MTAPGDMFRFLCWVVSVLFLRQNNDNEEAINFSRHASLIPELNECPKCRKSDYRQSRQSTDDKKRSAFTLYEGMWLSANKLLEPSITSLEHIEQIRRECRGQSSMHRCTGGFRWLGAQGITAHLPWPRLQASVHAPLGIPFVMEFLRALCAYLEQCPTLALRPRAYMTYFYALY